MNHWPECLDIWYGTSYGKGDSRQVGYVMLVFIGFWTENKREQKTHKTQWICEDQVSNTGPLGLLLSGVKDWNLKNSNLG